MKVLSVCGLHHTGKTTTIENIIKVLVRRGYSVGSVKHIHQDNFSIDTAGKNTHRHRMAGSSLVTSLSKNETAIMYQKKMDIYELLQHYDQDYVILEGLSGANVPNIAVAKDMDSIEINNKTIAVSGIVANRNIDNYKGLPVISCLDDSEKLADLIIEKVPNLMPNMKKECCSECGNSCEELLVKIINGEAHESDCKIRGNSNITLKINDKKIDMVPFVQNILYNQVTGVIKELKGYSKGNKITIEIDESN